MSEQSQSQTEDSTLIRPEQINMDSIRDSGVPDSPRHSVFRGSLHPLGNDPYGPSIVEGTMAAVSNINIPVIDDDDVSVHHEYPARAHSAPFHHRNTSERSLINNTGLRFCAESKSEPDTQSFAFPPVIPPRRRDAYSGYPGTQLQQGPVLDQRQTRVHMPAKPSVMPEKFDGNSVWSDYHAHFEICAKINGWTSLQKANYLAVSLKGTAQMLLGDLSNNTLNDYVALASELKSRFGYEGQHELVRTQLKNRKKRQDENFAELGQDIKRMTARAYPDAPADLRDSLAKGHFTDALRDSNMRWHIYHTKPTSLQDTIHLATEWQAFERAEQHQTGVANGNAMRRPVRVTDVASCPGGTREVVTLDDVQRQLKEAQAEIRRLNNQRSGARPYPPRTNRENMNGKPPVCWNCNEPGHFSRDCGRPAQTHTPNHSMNQGNRG